MKKICQQPKTASWLGPGTSSTHDPTSYPTLRFVVRGLPFLGIGLVVLCAGCSFSFEAPKLGRYGGGQPPKPPILLALGELRSTEPSLTGSNMVRFKAAFTDGLKRGSSSNLVHFVVQPTNLPPDAGCLVLSGTISEMKKTGGSAGLLLALGAERWRVAGSFEVRDTSGKLLTEVTGEYNLKGEVSVLGAGVYGPILSSWENMASGLGSAVGDEINRWLRPKKPITKAGTSFLCLAE